MTLMTLVLLAPVLPLQFSALQFFFIDREDLLHCFAEFFGWLCLGRGRHDRTISLFTPFATFLSSVAEDRHRPVL